MTAAIARGRYGIDGGKRSMKNDVSTQEYKLLCLASPYQTSIFPVLAPRSP